MISRSRILVDVILDQIMFCALVVLMVCDQILTIEGIFAVLIWNLKSRGPGQTFVIWRQTFGSLMSAISVLILDLQVSELNLLGEFLIFLPLLGLVLGLCLTHLLAFLVFGESGTEFEVHHVRI